MRKSLFLAVALFLFPLLSSLADTDAPKGGTPQPGKPALPVIVSVSGSFAGILPILGSENQFDFSYPAAGVSADISLPFLFPAFERFALSARVNFEWMNLTHAPAIRSLFPNDSVYVCPGLSLAGLAATYYAAPWLTLSADAMVGAYSLPGMPRRTTP